MVINNKVLLSLGDSNMIRHNEVEILKAVNQRRNSFTTDSLIHVHLLVLSKPELNRTFPLSFSDRGGLVTLRVADISMV